jgi:hypothetical protein
LCGSCLDRYEELLSSLGGSRGLKVILDHREGNGGCHSLASPRQSDRWRERRRHADAGPYLKLGWAVVETDEAIS